MKDTKSYNGFEQGPIRPPSEARSLLIRITRNCPWNRCTFCPVYKDEKFSRRPLEHVLRDIDVVKSYVDAIVDAKDPGARYYEDIFKDGHEDQVALYAASHFVAGGRKSIFLQDGNSLVIKPAEMIAILEHLQQSFPTVERITSYARSHTVARISDENLEKMAKAGLNRIHIGMESGSDKVLKMVRKGVDKATHIRGGQKVKQAGIQLSEYFMPGLGGSALSREHAVESADALNRINPDFIRLRSLAIPANAPLSDQYAAGEFEKMGEVAMVRELLLFIESLQGITSKLRSDHVLNLFFEVNGTLPKDQQRMIDPLRRFLELDEREQMLFCIGRRTNHFTRLDDLEKPELRDPVERMCDEHGVTADNMDQVIESIMQRFI